MLTATNFVFFGTPRFAVIVLDELKRAGLLPALIVTAPDKPAGRGLRLTPPPVKLWAQEIGVECIQPEKLDEKFARQMSNVKCQMSILAAYGKIIPRSIIDSFPHGILNVHPSLLPRYRGPSPIQSQILADDRDVGVTIMLLDEKMDHGDIIADCKLQIAEYALTWPPKASGLEKALAHAGGKLLAETIPRWLAGDIEPREQDHTRATYTKKITREDGLVALEDIINKPYETFLKIRAYDPWPGTYFFADRHGKKLRIKIKDAVFENGALKITRVLLEGGHETDYSRY
jgi:methionyl-tRNA formyltransferase